MSVEHGRQRDGIMTDSILIEGLQVDALVGVYAHERDAVQPLLLDIEMAYDNARACVRDDVADTLDYAVVCDTTRGFVALHAPQLLETLAEALAAHLLDRFATPQVRIRIRKPLAAQALGAGSVGIEIVRDAGR